MARKAGVSLILGGVALLLLGLFFLPFVIESEGEAITEAAAVENETGQDILDSQDDRLLGETSTIYLLGVVLGALVLVGFGIWSMAR